MLKASSTIKVAVWVKPIFLYDINISRNKADKIESDGVIDSVNIEEWLENKSFSMFPFYEKKL